MEELRSTEILDNEIRLDARKKAEKIVEAAQLKSQQLLDEVPSRVEEAKNKLLAKYEEKLSTLKKDQEAAIPLEKERFLVDFIQTSINKAIDEYLEAMTEDQKLGLLSSQLEKYESLLKGKKMNLSVYGIEPAKVKKALSKDIEIASCEKTEFNKLIVENTFGLTNKMGIILESEDKAVRLRLTLSEIISQLQEKYRVELYDELFGGRLEK